MESLKFKYNILNQLRQVFWENKVLIAYPLILPKFIVILNYFYMNYFSSSTE